MQLLHSFELELQKREEKIVERDEQLRHMQTLCREKELSSAKIIDLLRSRMQQDIDRL